jgi:4-hydroxy-tetrahydrodipicolinate synthase
MANEPVPDARSGKRLLLNGLFPATITPFNADFSVDTKSLERHLDATLSAEGVSGVVINAGAGEKLQLRPQEELEIIRMAARLRRPGQLVVAGAENQNPGILVEESLAAKAAGADVLLVFPPFDTREYRRLSGHPPSVRAFFERMDKQVDLPMIVYQYPKSVGCAYSMDSLLAVTDLKNVVAIKCGVTADFNAYKEIWDALHDKISVLSAVDSPPLLDTLKYGAHGALLGVSAIGTDRWARLLKLITQGNLTAANALFDNFCRPVMAGVYENQQPTRFSSASGATKEALVMLGQIASARVRPPTFGPDSKARAEIAAALVKAGLLSQPVAVPV